MRRFGVGVALLGSLVFTLPAAAAGLTLDLIVERKPAVLFRGEPRSPHELIQGMARQNVGRTDFLLKVSPGANYLFRAARDPDEKYRIDPSSLSLAAPARVTARVAIRYPKLSDAQYHALRGHPEYPLVYGFIRGIVEHEELHAREFARYARKVRATYEVPPLGENPVVTPREDEDVGILLARYVQDRLQEALTHEKRASTAAQRKIDRAGKATRVEFRFIEPVEEAAPSTLVYQTEGKFRVSFQMSKGTPRPPEPRTKY